MGEVGDCKTSFDCMLYATMTGHLVHSAAQYLQVFIQIFLNVQFIFLAMITMVTHHLRDIAGQ